MPQKITINRTETPNKPPTGLLPGELSIEMAMPTRLWVGVPTNLDPTGKKLLNASVTVSDTPPVPSANALWWESDTGILWIYYMDADGGQWVQAAGSSGGASGVLIADTAPSGVEPGTLWWESDTAILWLFYDDGNSQQWVQAAGSSGGGGGTPVDAYTKAESDAKYVELAGDTMSGSLVIQPSTGNAAIGLVKGGNALATLEGYNGAYRRWIINLGDTTPESGNEAGSNFSIIRHTDTGVNLGPALTITRATGDVIVPISLTTPWLTVDGAQPHLYMSKSGSGQQNVILGTTAGSSRWSVVPGNTDPENGLNTGSNFGISRCDDAGVLNLNPCLLIDRATGGSTFGGHVTLFTTSPHFSLHKKASGEQAIVQGTLNAVPRWAMELGDATAEGGASAGSNFALHRHADDGTRLGTALSINRATGSTVFSGSNNLVYSAISAAAVSTAAFVADIPAPSNYYMWQMCAGLNTGTISTDGTSTIYSTTSDVNLKEDLKSFDAGNIVDATEVYDFKWRDRDARAYGVIAQQAIEVYPQAVVHSESPIDGSDFWGVDYSKYVPVILQELKRLRARVAELEGRDTINPVRSR